MSLDTLPILKRIKQTYLVQLGDKHRLSIGCSDYYNQLNSQFYSATKGEDVALDMGDEQMAKANSKTELISPYRTDIKATAVMDGSQLV